jgi:hypothetical protein
VGADDARLLDRPHGVDMVEAAARHQLVTRGSRAISRVVLGAMNTQRVAVL